jgi:hypothetical protein
MNSKQLIDLLGKYAPNMPLSTALEVVKEWDEMREELCRSHYSIVTSLRLLGFNDSGYPTKQIPGLTDEDKNVLGMMTRIHAGAACGIHGLEHCLEGWRKQFPIDKKRIESIDSSFAIIKDKW